MSLFNKIFNFFCKPKEVLPKQSYFVDLIYIYLDVDKDNSQRILSKTRIYNVFCSDEKNTSFNIYIKENSSIKTVKLKILQKCFENNIPTAQLDYIINDIMRLHYTCAEEIRSVKNILEKTNPPID